MLLEKIKSKPLITWTVKLCNEDVGIMEYILQKYVHYACYLYLLFQIWLWNMRRVTYMKNSNYFMKMFFQNLKAQATSLVLLSAATMSHIFVAMSMFSLPGIVRKFWNLWHQNSCILLIAFTIAFNGTYVNVPQRMESFCAKIPTCVKNFIWSQIPGLILRYF